MMDAILCIGAAHLDRKAIAADRIMFGTSNPVRTHVAFGGVARNVAENLRRLDVPAALASRVGADVDGGRVIEGLVGMGVDTSLVARSPTSPTASYTALIAPGGELVVAVADMAIYDEMAPETLAPLLPAMAQSDIWFVDCNLPAATLRFLLSNAPPDTAIHVDAVSVPKAARLEGNLRGIDTLFANIDEASRLAGLPIRTPKDLCTAANRLLAAGAGRVILTRGKEGALLAEPGGHAFFPAAPAAVTEVTGAGDALIAGYLFGRRCGRDARDALRVGLAAAALAIETPNTVYGALSVRRLLDRARIEHARD